MATVFKTWTHKLARLTARNSALLNSHITAKRGHLLCLQEIDTSLVMNHMIRLSKYLLSGSLKTSHLFRLYSYVSKYLRKQPINISNIFYYCNSDSGKVFLSHFTFMCHCLAFHKMLGWWTPISHLTVTNQGDNGGVQRMRTNFRTNTKNVIFEVYLS